MSLPYDKAYLKYKGQLIILISGLAGCGYMQIGKDMSKDFNIKFLDQYDYYRNDYDTKVRLPNGEEVINWDSVEAFNWIKLNNDVNRLKDKGVIIVGNILPQDKLKFEPDIHIHLSISKRQCTTKRHNFLEENKEKYKKEYSLINSVTEKLIMNRITYPYYL